jgi:hypothetical protein
VGAVSRQTSAVRKAESPRLRRYVRNPFENREDLDSVRELFSTLPLTCAIGGAGAGAYIFMGTVKLELKIV